jgi:hypothetical protein
MTDSPRRYGFHATLKPPFALAEGIVEDLMLEKVEELAETQAGFAITLRVDAIDGFLALVPDHPPPELQHLADRCVMELDDFRRPPPDDELARRRKSTLTPRQDQHLLRWGYPYVLEDFRFHMTLSERLAPDALERLKLAASSHFAPGLSRPVPIDGLTVFTEASPGAAFNAVRHVPFPLPSMESGA